MVHFNPHVFYFQGSGGADCQFRITRFRSQGFIRLSPVDNESLFVGMEDNGQVKLFTHQADEATRLYPELVKGKRTLRAVHAKSTLF